MHLRQEDVTMAAGRSSQGSMTTAALVQRARQELLLKVHPDKCHPRDARLAAAAFAFLQEAAEGLLRP